MKKYTKPHILRRIRPGLAALGLGVIILGFCLSPVVKATDYQAEINSLNNQNSQIQNNLSSLQNQAGTYQQSIANYQAQIAAVENSIAVNQNKMQQDQQQIAEDNAKIAQNRAYLATDLKTMYVQGQMTTIEQLATSQDLSTFVNQQEDNIKVQDQLDSLLTKIKNLQLQAQKNKDQVSVILKLEQMQQAQIASEQNQLNQLLAMNQQQQASYNAQVASNNSQIATLVAEQIAANKRLMSTGTVTTGTPCGGSYPSSAQGPNGPWGCNYVHSSDFTAGCSYLDSWGMCNRECVSYTAWMVYAKYGIDVTGFGNANQWPAHAQAAGISTGSTPQAGSVAIYMGGSGDPWGHAMWVDSVNGDGTITVGQYNYAYDGNYSTATIPASGLTYIYFGG